MRIFYAVGSRPGGSLVGSTVWRRNLYDALVGLGHDIVSSTSTSSPPTSTQTPPLRGRRRSSERIGPGSRGLCCSRSSALTQNAIGSSSATSTRRSLARVIRRSPYGHHHRELVLQCVVPVPSGERDRASVFLLSGSGEFRLDDYRWLGARPDLLSRGCQRGLLQPQDSRTSYDIAFVGAAYGDRPGYMKALVDAGLDVVRWGPGWSELAEPLSVRARCAERLRRPSAACSARPLLPRDCLARRVAKCSATTTW